MKSFISKATIFCFLTVLFLSMPAVANASTNGHSRDEAVQWVRTLVNQNWGSASNTVNYDGSEWTPYDYGEPQCVDLIAAYWDYLVGWHKGLNANAYADTSLPDGWTYQSSPEPGDIVVWDSGKWGHIGIVVSTNGSQYWFVDTNGDNNYYYDASGYRYNTKATERGPKSYSDRTTFIRPDFAPSTFELDVNGWLDGAEGAGVTGYATFDVYIDGNLVANDVGDFCTSYGAGASYEIKDIKVANGKAFDGYSDYTRSGYTSGWRKGTLNANTDVRLQLHTVDAAAFDRKWVPTDVTVFDGHSYYFYNVPVTWYGGEIVSEYLGGHLVTITSEAENNFVKEFIGACNLWIGATDKDQEGNWKWVSGEPFSYTDWGSGQPDNDSGGDEGAEHYAHIWYNSGAWNDNNGCVKYAFLCEIDSAYSILFNTNGGSGGPGVQWKPVKKSITLSNEIPVKAGYEFMGWQLGDKVYQPGDTYSLDQNRTMTAIWKSLEYTIRYDANGGTNPPENMIVNGGTISISTDIPTRAHHKFIGWGTTATATEVEYAPGDEYKAGQDVTLYAIWERQLENLLILPKSLTTIEEEAFANVTADAVVIPKTVSTIENNAFGDVAIYGYVGTEAETYAIKNNMTFIPLTDDWVLAEDVPDGAKVTDQKWTYLQASSETMESTETSVDGWTQVGFTWEQTGTGTHVYANFPGGFDTGSSFYNAYAKSALSSSETATTKREVSGSTHKDYIYWHWCFTDYVEDGNRNVAVEDAERYGVQTGNVYRDYVFFDAFETTVSLNPEGMTTSGLKSFDGMYSTYHHPEYNLPEYASWWWWRFEVLQQTYTDYQKLFTYIREDAELLESAVEVTPGDNISNVQHWVKYSF